MRPEPWRVFFDEVAVTDNRGTTFTNVDRSLWIGEVSGVGRVAIETASGEVVIVGFAQSGMGFTPSQPPG